MSKPSTLPAGHIYLGAYLLERLSQLDCRVVYGVPGDFNLGLLDLVEDHRSVEWVGCCNELNAGYAADGYARAKQSQHNSGQSEGEGGKTPGGVRGIGALLTTFGVGELSAVNAIAGAYAERVPILHIVGVPSTKLQKSKALLHHTLGDGKFNVFEESAKGVTAAQAFLQSAEGAAKEIDRVLRVALETARPTYLTLPTDLVFSPVLSSLLDTPIISPPRIDGDLILASGEVDEEQKKMKDFVVAEIVRLWDQSKNPIFLIDACAIRYGVTELVQQLVDATKAKYFTTPMGKSALPEDVEKGFGGVYAGGISLPEVKDAVESADLTILVGSIQSDFNTGEFSYKMKTEQMIELHSDHTVVQFAQYPAMSFYSILPALIKALKPKVVSTPKRVSLKDIPAGDPKATVKQDAFWPLWGNFLRPHDVLIAETGTSSFGLVDVPLPPLGATTVSQVLWGSIGWAGGATLGCAKAAEEVKLSRRTILFIGDGSLQLTVQEISTMLRQGLKPIIVVLNNDGYVIERLIHGPDRVYNDISRWKWQELLSFFNADNIPHRSWLASTREEFEEILEDEDFARADRCQLLEVKMDRLDAPRSLILQAKLSADLNEE